MTYEFIKFTQYNKPKEVIILKFLFRIWSLVKYNKIKIIFISTKKDIDIILNSQD